MLRKRKGLHFSEALQLLVSDEALNHDKAKRFLIYLLILPLFHVFIGPYVVEQGVAEVEVFALENLGRGGDETPHRITDTPVSGYNVT